MLTRSRPSIACNEPLTASIKRSTPSAKRRDSPHEKLDSFRTSSSMAGKVKRRHALLSHRQELPGERREESVTPKRERDARAMAATMDHSSIRGLATAFHRFFAGLPRSDYGDHPRRDARSKLSRIPLIGAAHRVSDSVCKLWVGLELVSDLLGGGCWRGAGVFSRRAARAEQYPRRSPRALGRWR